MTLNVNALPADIITSTRAVLWNHEVRDGKPTKVPYRVHQPARKAAVDDPSTWAPMCDAIAAVEDGKADGAGIVLGDGQVGVDLDHVRDVETGTLTDEAQAIIAALDSYTEISPSQTGVHILLRGALPDGRRRKGPIEMYADGRYFTVTGHHVEGTPSTIEDRTAALAALHARVFPGDGQGPSPTPRASTPLDLSDAELLDRARAAANGAKFTALWNGDTSGHGGDDSAADLALCSSLAFWFDKDAARMDRVFRQSGLMRDKWDSRRGERTYGEITVDKAIAGCRETYAGTAWSTSSTTTGDYAHAPDVEAANAAPVTPETTRWQRAADAIAEPTPEAIVDGLVWADSVSVLVGESASGKTFVLLALAAAVSAGLPWLHRGVLEGSVVYVGFEGHVGLRLRALREAGGQWLEHVYIIRASDPLSPTIDRDRAETPSRGERDAIRDLKQIATHVAGWSSQALVETP